MGSDSLRFTELCLHIPIKELLYFIFQIYKVVRNTVSFICRVYSDVPFLSIWLMWHSLLYWSSQIPRFWLYESFLLIAFKKYH